MKVIRWPLWMRAISLGLAITLAAPLARAHALRTVNAGQEESPVRSALQVGLEAPSTTDSHRWRRIAVGMLVGAAVLIGSRSAGFSSEVSPAHPPASISVPAAAGVAARAEPSQTIAIGRPSQSAKHVPPPRLVRDYGPEKAAIIYDEVRKTVERLTPDLSERQRETNIRRVTDRIHLPTAWNMMWSMSSWVAKAAWLLSVVGAVAFSALFAIDLIKGSRRVRNVWPPVAFSVLILLFHGWRALLGAQNAGFGFASESAGSMIIPRDESGVDIRGTVSHEIGHLWYPSFQATSKVMVEAVPEAVAALRDLEDGRRQLAHEIIDLAAKTLQWRGLDDMRADSSALFQRFDDEIRNRVSNEDVVHVRGFIAPVIPRWYYFYGGCLGEAAYLLSDKDLPTAYRVIDHLGKGRSLYEAVWEEALRRRAQRAVPAPAPPSAQSKSGLEPASVGVFAGSGERTVVMAHELDAAHDAVVALAALPETPARAPEMTVLVFADPALFDLAILAARQGHPVAVLSDGPEAQRLRGLRDALSRQGLALGPLAIGVAEAVSLLTEYDHRRSLTTRFETLRLLKLQDNDLLPQVTDALTATRTFLDLARGA